jgi:hypothetical protein
VPIGRYDWLDAKKSGSGYGGSRVGQNTAGRIPTGLGSGVNALRYEFVGDDFDPD